MKYRRRPDAGVNEPPESSGNTDAENAQTAQPVGDDRRLRRRRRWRWSAFAVALVLVLWAAITARLFIWPDLVPLPQRADAIIELAGPAVDGRDQMAIK